MDVLSHVGMGLLTAGVFFVLFRLRSQWARQVGNLRVLRYPWPLKILATIGVALFSMGMIALGKGASGMELLKSLLVISPILLLVLGGAGEVFAYEISYDDTTIYCCSPWTGANAVMIDDLTEITYSSWWSHYVLHFQTGQVVRVNKYLSGAEEFVWIMHKVVELRREIQSVHGY